MDIVSSRSGAQEDRNPAKRPNTEVSPDSPHGMADIAMVRYMLHEIIQGYGLDSLKVDIVDMKKSAASAAKLVDNHDIEIASMKIELTQVRQELKKEHEARLHLEAQSRRSNLKFYNIKEEPNETAALCEKKLRYLDILMEKMPLNSERTLRKL